MRLISFRGLLGLFLVLLGVVIILNRVAGVDIELGTIWSAVVIPLLLGLHGSPSRLTRAVPRQSAVSLLGAIHQRAIVGSNWSYLPGASGRNTLISI